jgi:hypothetical protein
MNFTDDYDMDEYGTTLAGYSDETLAIIDSTANHDNRRNAILPPLVMKTDEQTVREVMHLHVQCAGETGRFLFNSIPLIGIIRGLHHYDQYKNTPLDTLTGDELEIASALINVTAAVYCHYKNQPLHITTPNDPATSEIYLNDTAMRLVTEHYKRVDELLGFLFSASECGDEVVAGLPYLRWYQKQDLSTVTDQTIDTALHYLHLTEELYLRTDRRDLTLVAKDDDRYGDDYEAIHLSNPELETFIESNPDSLWHLIDYIKVRKAADLQGLREYMDNQTILKEGVL